jgi:hypothetical protein
MTKTLICIIITSIITTAVALTLDHKIHSVNNLFLWTIICVIINYEP